ncbi:MAG TPA: hypothetical protein DCL49_01250, partial [Candidatus Omnitrophica bacterium]|nr:hypothetical protein [Candidatus Omnitrophota bacterium]
AKGEYNLKETIASAFGQSIRSYVSGGISVGSPISEGVVKVSSPVAAVTEALTGSVPAPVAAGSPIIVDKSDAGRLSAITLNSGLSVRLNGWSAETLREVLRAGQPVDIVVFPPELYRNGIEYGSPEFLVYYNLFFASADNDAPINLGWRRGNYTFLVAQNKEQKEAIEMIVTRSFLGSPREFYDGIMNGAINIKGISPEDIRSSDIEHFMQNRAMFPTVGEKLEIRQFVKVHILGEEFDYKTKAGSNLKLKIERDDNERYKITETGNGQDLVYQNIIADEYRLPVMQSIAVTNTQIDAHNFLNRPEFGYTILGDSHGFDPDGNNTSILVSVGGKYLLIDGSPATYQITKDLKIPSLDIEYVYLTHTHDDHDAILSRVLNGVPVKLIATPAVYANFVAKAKDKLKLYGQDINIDEWVDYIRILPGQKLPIFNGKAIIECPSFYNKHTVPTSAVKIGYVGQGEDIENSIAYTADTQLDPRLLQFAEESDVIFHDAGVLPLHPSPGGLDKQITDEKLRPKVRLVHASKKDIEKAGKINLSKGDLLKSTSLIPADFSERAKNNDNIRECLAAVAYLSSLSPEALQALAKKTKVRNFLPGDKIVKQGETIQYLQPSRDVLYLIVSGEAKVNIGGKEIRLKPGMTFGEFSAVNPLQPRSVDVVAGDNGLVAISFSKATIVALIKDFPEVRESVERIQHNLLYLEKLSEIEKSPFNQLPIEVLYDLAEKLKVVEFEKGKDILIEGEQSGSEGAYIITEGQVEVASKLGGKLKEIYNSSPDNVVGEGAFFAPAGKRNATVTTVTKVKALHIAFDDFQKALEHHPSLKYKFYVLSANRRDENNNNGHQVRKMASVASPMTLEYEIKAIRDARKSLEGSPAEIVNNRFWWEMSFVPLSELLEIVNKIAKGYSEFLTGDLDVSKLRKALGDNRLASEIVREELRALGVSTVNTASEEKLLIAFNNILKSKDFLRKISGEKYKSRIHIEVEPLLEKALMLDLTLTDLDYRRINRELLGIFYPLEIRQTYAMVGHERAKIWLNNILPELLRIEREVKENMERYKKELADFFLGLGNNRSINISADEKERLTVKYSNINELNDVDSILDAAEEAYILPRYRPTKTLKTDKGKSGSPLTGVSSAVVSEANIVPEVKRGGIDLTDRAMHIKLERVGSFASSALVLPEINNVDTLDLDKEYEQIQAMVSSSIRPSDIRILEFAAACYYKGEFDQRLTQIADCIKNTNLADEGLGKESSDALRLAT